VTGFFLFASGHFSLLLFPSNDFFAAQSKSSYRNDEDEVDGAIL